MDSGLVFSQTAVVSRFWVLRHTLSFTTLLETKSWSTASLLNLIENYQNTLVPVLSLCSHPAGMPFLFLITYQPDSGW